MSSFFRRKKRRRRRPRYRPPELTVAQILAWADAWHASSGAWPKNYYGRIPGSLGETWARVDNALYVGLRGLPGGSSLPRLLAERRGVRNHMGLPHFSVPRILAWADAYHERHGRWPTLEAGPIPEAPGETWRKVHKALSDGMRGLPGGSSLAQLLARQRGRRHHLRLPRLIRKQILAWADAHYRRTGRWPSRHSGVVAGAAGEKWDLLDDALYLGRRGLRPGSRLAQLLDEHRGPRPDLRRQPFSVKQVLSWADAYHARTGAWPNTKSGPIAERPFDTWNAVENALRAGCRGFRGGSSLARFLLQHRGVPIRNR